MRTIRWHLHVGIVGADREGVIEVEDDATDAEIEDDVRDTVFNFLDWGWTELVPEEPADDR